MVFKMVDFREAFSTDENEENLFFKFYWSENLFICDVLSEIKKHV